MNSHYLILGFKDAKLFRKHRKTSDKSFDVFYGTKQDRKELEEFVEPIVVNHVSNMLHVLMGERPVPTNRYTFYNRIPWIDEMALNSYLTINNTLFYNKSRDVWEPNRESFSTVKAVWDSWNPAVTVTWEIIRQFMGVHYNWFVDMVNELVQMDTCCTSVPYTDINLALRNLEDSKKNTFFDVIRERKLAPIIDYINKDITTGLIKKENRTALMVVNGIEKVSKLNGEIVVPVSERELELLKNAKGVATILDGGLVFVKSIVPASRFRYDPDIHIQVKTISTEKQ